VEKLLPKEGRLLLRHTTAHMFSWSFINSNAVDKHNWPIKSHFVLLIMATLNAFNVKKVE